MVSRSSGVDQYVQQIPLLALVFLPLISAIFGLRYINLKSVIHFQQGTLGTSPWRAAATMTFLTLPVFFVWCLVIRGPSAIFFQVGASLALILTTLTASPILHYLPSPSLSKYFQLRYLSDSLRLLVSIFQCSLLTLTSLILLYLASSFLFLLYILVPTFGIGIFLFYGLENIRSIDNIIEFEKYDFGASFSSIFIGFIVNFYLLNSSFLYQVYSPMPTMHKLRLTLTFYGVFQFFAAFFAFIFATLFLDFLENHCKFPMSFGSFFQFSKVTLSNKFQVFTVCASCISILSFCLQWCLMGLITLIWEDFLAKKLRNWNPIQQLCSLQFALLILTTALVVLAVVVNLMRWNLGLHLPSVIYVVFSLFSISAGLTICGYYLPFCSSRGAILAFSLTSILTILNLSIYFLNNSTETFSNFCNLQHGLVMVDDPLIISSSTTQKSTISMDRIVYFVSHLPPQTQPIITILMFISLCAFISFLTGGQDQMGLDWNLIAFTWATSIRGTSTNTTFSTTTKRPFFVVDSESFKYAQQQNQNPTPSPDINVFR
ncbi:unnamed protein product [Caenorhabditis angaria]|uniref:Transmembrane protein n=1 Tax=Caenorhabditis angaria TaxID=860376 RepID=A0A9P1MV94_9PELO|nr:unnamed protein product [Caenorhabditis angaria]